MLRHLTLSLSFAFSMAALLTLPALGQQSDTQDKPFDVRSSIGDMHVGKDADARSAGLPLYPGANPKHEDSNDPLNFGILTESFGIKLVIAKYESDDAPSKVIAYYRDKLKKYGKVLECHTQRHGADVEVHSDAKDSSESGSKNEEQASKQLKCDSNDGPVTELKVGTEDNEHVVAIEPRDSGKGASFALVYVRTRGKQGDI
ncbi:MAG TPA: hypothetical protein VKR60_12360 [Candidatus Sulfotelmatobacter sp.]|nr:hypothetical protein [Candidatus Sulfotelmatobacter sp.]